MLVCVATALTIGAGCRGTSPAAAPPVISPDTWAVVDGREIRRDDVEKAYRRTAQPGQTLSDEETLTAKLSVLNDLIVQDILLAKARDLKIEVPATELDTAYGDAKKNVPDDRFQQELARRSLTPDDMREGLRRELLTQKVIDREVASKVTVTDQEVTDFFNTNRAQFNVAEDAYHLAQIVVTPVKDAQPANRTGDDASTPQAAAAKIQMLMDKLKQGAAFSDLAADYSEDPQSAPRGGDLGFVPLSALKKAPPPLRDAVLKATPGTVNVVSGNGAHTIVLLVAFEKAGQRDLSMPVVKEGITSTLKGRKDQLLRAAYLTAVRNDAKVANHLAKRLVDGRGKLPAH